MPNKLLLQLELQAISTAEDWEITKDVNNLHVADLIRHTRLLLDDKYLSQVVESYYSFYKEYQEGILTYIEPFNKALANCKGCGTDANQAYLSYCEKLAAQFKLIQGL